MASEQTQAYLKGLESRLAADGCNPQWQSWGAAPVPAIGAIYTNYIVRKCNVYFPQPFVG